MTLYSQAQVCDKGRSTALWATAECSSSTYTNSNTSAKHITTGAKNAITAVMAVVYAVSDYGVIPLHSAQYNCLIVCIIIMVTCS